MANYLTDSYNMSIKPILDFISPVTGAVGNFLTSGENYDPDKPVTTNLIESFQTPANLFSDNWMSDDMDLNFGGGDIPVASDYKNDMTLVPKNVPADYFSTLDRSYPYVPSDDGIFDYTGVPSAYTSTPTDGTAIQQRPWKPDEIDISAVGTHNSGDRGYDDVGGLKEGWALGIDGVPYNTALFALNDAAIAAARGGGSSGSGSGGGGGGSSASVLGTRMPLNRTPSGSVYAPDLSAYNDSSLFNYTGPGGASEYTYGQDLPYQGAGYGLWGSPTDVANPYFWGQFANAAATGAATGPADAAINMPSVEMPAGVPSTNTTTGGGNVGGGGSNNAGGGHNYWSEDNQRVYEMQQQRNVAGGNRNLSEAQINQILADEHRMQQGQLGSGFKGEEELNRDVQKTIFDNEYFDTPILGNDTVTAPYVGDAGRGTIVEQPGDRLDDYISPYVGDAGRGTIVEQPGDRFKGLLNDYAPLDEQVAPYLDSLKPEIPLDEQMAVTDRTQELLAMQEIERQAAAREMLRQSVLNPDTTVREPVFGGLDGFPGQYGLHYNEPSMIPSDWTGDAGRGTVVEPLGERAAYGANAGRGNVVEGAGDRAAFPPGLWDAPAYEREVYLGEIPAESTSNLTAIELAPAIEAINAKYRGSTTDASAEAELGEIIDVIQLQFSEPMDLDEYNELSTRDLIKPSLTYLEDKAGSHSASSDLYAQNERQQHGRVQPVVNSGPPRRQAIPRIPEPSIFDRVADSFSRNFSLFGGR